MVKGYWLETKENKEPSRFLSGALKVAATFAYTNTRTTSRNSLVKCHVLCYALPTTNNL